MNDDTNANTGESIRVLKFDGNRDMWRTWSIKTQAIGEWKGWWSEIVATDDLDVKFTEDNLKERIKLNNQAHHHLLLSCVGEAFEYLIGSRGSAKKAWNILKEKYESSETEDLMELLEKSIEDRSG